MPLLKKDQALDIKEGFVVPANWKSPFFLGAGEEPDRAGLLLLGVPMEYTVSFRPGTRFGPEAVRAVSESLEEYSLYQDADLREMNFADLGDLVLPPGNVNRGLELAKTAAAGIFKDGKVPLFLGGEHLLSYATVQAAVEFFPDLVVLHMDAHTDLRSEYMGEQLSHASTCRLIAGCLREKRLYQFGIRSGPREDFLYARRHTNLFTEKVLEPLRKVLPELKGKPVYCSLDIDLLDPAFAPGTGTPEPGGCSFQEVLSAVLLLSELHVVGMDLVEVAPEYDPSGITSLAAAKLVREAIIAVMKGKGAPEQA